MTWARLGLGAAGVSIAAVLLVQALAVAMWPEIALFKPLDNYARTALFVLAPTVAATAVLAWLVRHRERPARDFLALAAVVLVVSIIPDYALPFANKTLLASSVTALLHLVAGVATTSVLLVGCRRLAGRP